MQVCVVLIAGVDRYIPSTMLVDVCQCCRLLLFVCLLHFQTPSLLLNLVNKKSESEVTLLTSAPYLPATTTSSCLCALRLPPFTRQNTMYLCLCFDPRVLFGRFIPFFSIIVRVFRIQRLCLCCDPRLLWVLCAGHFFYRC